MSENKKTKKEEHEEHEVSQEQQANEELPKAKKEYDIIEKIDSLSDKLGLSRKHRTLLGIKDTDDPNVKELYLKEGDWNEDEPWFAIEDNNDKKAYAFIPADAFAQLIDTLRQSQQENFNLKLEKTIWQNIPADFEDVWVVAMDEIRRYAQHNEPGKPVSIDLDKLIKKIKKEHPNLFINLRDFMPQQMPQIQDNHD